MTIIYRILSFIINVVALMLAISLFGSIGVLLSSPQTMLSAFLMVAVILYSWFSARFKNLVLQQQRIVQSRLRDWVRVNGIVTLLFSLISIISITSMLVNPGPFVEAMEAFQIKISSEKLVVLLVGMLVYAIFLLVHILWTFALMKKNASFFQEVVPEE